jgi:hypothetical protein
MRIDQEEIRFWVRKIKLIKGAKNTNIETDLFNEIPKIKEDGKETFEMLLTAYNDA